MTDTGASPDTMCTGVNVNDDGRTPIALDLYPSGWSTRFWNGAMHSAAAPICIVDDSTSRRVVMSIAVASARMHRRQYPSTGYLRWSASSGERYIGSGPGARSSPAATQSDPDAHSGTPGWLNRRHLHSQHAPDTGTAAGGAAFRTEPATTDATIASGLTSCPKTTYGRLATKFMGLTSLAIANATEGSTSSVVPEGRRPVDEHAPPTGWTAPCTGCSNSQ